MFRVYFVVVAVSYRLRTKTEHSIRIHAQTSSTLEATIYEGVGRALLSGQRQPQNPCSRIICTINVVDRLMFFPAASLA